MNACPSAATVAEAERELANLQESLDVHQGMVRRAERQARDQVVIVSKYEKQMQVMRDALGKAEVDRQRTAAEHQRDLGAIAKKLRVQRGLADEAQRALQQERSVKQPISFDASASTSYCDTAHGAKGLLHPDGGHPEAHGAVETAWCINQPMFKPSAPTSKRIGMPSSIFGSSKFMRRS